MKEKQQVWCGKLILGTVQFGLNYGISNTSGQILPEEVDAILEYAQAHGMTGLDTAAAYGTSEGIIGRCLSERKHSFDIISKLPGGLAEEELSASLTTSLDRLQVDQIDGYLVHDSAEMMRPEVSIFLKQAKQEGLVRRVGVSVYRLEEVRRLWDEGITFEVLQIPFNVLDQRFKELFPELKERGVEIHARSVFLQGLLFLKPDELPDQFSSIRGLLAQLHDLVHEKGLSLSSLLLNYAMAQGQIDRVLIGVAGLAQLKENVEAFDDFDEVRQLLGTLDQFSIDDEKIVLPTHWS